MLTLAFDSINAVVRRGRQVVSIDPLMRPEEGPSQSLRLGRLLHFKWITSRREKTVSKLTLISFVVPFSCIGNNNENNNDENNEDNIQLEQDNNK